MAQIVKLKRTAVSGKIPTISNLQLGELAMNTYDGRIFFEKSSSEETIQEILTTNSHPFSITGSLYLNGAITASFFKGDGSQLTNLPTDISIAEATTVTASYSDSDDITVTHNFNSYNVLVSVYDNNRNLLIPATTSLPSVNTARVTLSGTQTGFVVVAKGGHLISGSQIADNANKLNSQVGSYYLNWNNFNNIPAGIVSGSSQLTSTFDTRYLNTNGSGTLAFADAGGGAFNFISNTSFTTNTSVVNITSGFSSDYDDYMVIISGLKCTSSPEISLRLFRNGTIQTSGYYSQRHIMSYQSHSVSAPYTTYIQLGSVGSSDQITSAILYFHNMRDATDARYHNVSWRIYGMPYGPGGSSDVNSATGQGICDRTGSGFFDGFRIYPSLGQFSQGSFTFYGISKS